MIGYKGFDRNLCCKDMQYELNHVHEHIGTLLMCNSGFHFCTVPVNVLRYYPNVEGNKYAIIEASNVIKHKEDKSVTNRLIIKKLLTYEELLEHCTGRFTNPDGTEEWYLNGKLHRDGDLPAVIFSNDEFAWYKNGERHRDGDEAAVISKISNTWYQNGKIHRDGDNPAIICKNGNKLWYKHNLLHRDGDLPAVIYSNKCTIWYKDGKIHRDGDNPAIIRHDGTKLWYYNGIFNRIEKPI